jgi:hypothetical protein
MPPTCSSIVGTTAGPINVTFTGSSTDYVTYTLQFTADSSVTTLKFENLYAGDPLGYYPHIDNVSVTGPAPVPIPAAFWLFGSSLIGLVGVARRKTIQPRV